MTEIRIGSGKCNNERFKVLDLSKYKNLKSVVIGYGSYKYVDELIIIGLKDLETIEMDELNEESYNFWFASLELKSVLIHRE